MGLLVDGVWQDRWYDTAGSGGRFERQRSAFRHWVTADGSAGPSGEGGFVAEPGRYHLYVSLACPWAHRTLIMRALKGLEGLVSVSVVHWRMREQGWTFDDGPGVVPDTELGARRLYEVYQAADPHYTGRVTTPALWDRHRRTIVNNESSEILRMFNTAFDGVGAQPGDYYPPELRDEIDALNERIYATVNNGVYRAGFATTRARYEEAVRGVFATLDTIETHLATNRYLCGARLTEADWRLFPTLVRFDVAYHGHFKCNLRRLVDYPNLWAYTRELYQYPGVAATVDLDAIRINYYRSQVKVNPSRVVAIGPRLDFTAPHDRGRLPAA